MVTRRKIFLQKNIRIKEIPLLPFLRAVYRKWYFDIRSNNRIDYLSSLMEKYDCPAGTVLVLPIFTFPIFVVHFPPGAEKP